MVFALPDSLTLVSTSANLRLESFLFTSEAFSEVRDRLSPDGVFVLYNFYREDWLPEKIAGMLQGSFGSPPIVRIYGGTAATLAAGPLIAGLTARHRLETRSTGWISRLPRPRRPTTGRSCTSRTAFIAPYYGLAIGIIIAFAVLLVVRAARRSGTSVRQFSPHFFVLGVAFLLLETKSIATFSLLFGTTWIVNSLVFFAVLASVLAAILVNQRVRFRNPIWLYAGLFGSIGLAIAAATRVAPARAGVAALCASPAALAFAPIFFANLVFSYSFRDTKAADMAFASNLLGAVVGGAVEYVALVTGYSALLFVVGGLYLLAWGSRRASGSSPTSGSARRARERPGAASLSQVEVPQ